MSTPEHELRKRCLSVGAEVAGVAILFALIVTACGWLWVGKASPFNHGVFPDVRTSPSVTLWVVANFPAAILFINVFGKAGPEWAYFFCVFTQWLVVGIGLGALIAAARRVVKHI